MNRPLKIRSGSLVQCGAIDAAAAQAKAANEGDHVMRTLLFLAIALVLASPSAISQSPAARPYGRRPLPF